LTESDSLSSHKKLALHVHCHLACPHCFRWFFRSATTEKLLLLHRLHKYIYG